MQDFNPLPSIAVVSRPPERPGAPELYLRVTPHGLQWTADAEEATTFETLREATRAALRLPCGLRAFGLPMGHQPRDWRDVH